MFLNSVAHLQHHYLFNAAPYDGKNKNPDWYINAEKDPLLEGLKSYDQIVQQILNLPGEPRVFIATGLHQNPVEEPVFYWRLKEHEAFLDKIGVPYTKAIARMSRDFLVECENEADAKIAQEKLEACTDKNGIRIFEEVDNRGTSLFVTLTYPHDLPEGESITHASGIVADFRSLVGFVALKNGEHDGEGYFVDSASQVPANDDLPITEIFNLSDQHFGQ